MHLSAEQEFLQKIRSAIVRLSKTIALALPKELCQACKNVAKKSKLVSRLFMTADTNDFGVTRKE